MHAFETRGEGWLLSSLFQPPFRLLPFMQLLAKHIIVGSRHQRTWSYGKSILALTSSSIYRRGKRPSPLLQYFSFSCFAKLSTNNALYIQSVPFINQLDRTVPSIRIECFVVCKKCNIRIFIFCNNVDKNYIAAHRNAIRVEIWKIRAMDKRQQFGNFVSRSCRSWFLFISKISTKARQILE